MAKKCIKIRRQYVSNTIYNTQSRKDSKTEEYGQEISGCKVKKHSWVALNRLGLLLANTSQLTRNPLFDVKRRTLKIVSRFKLLRRRQDRSLSRILSVMPSIDRSSRKFELLTDGKRTIQWEFYEAAFCSLSLLPFCATSCLSFLSLSHLTEYLLCSMAVLVTTSQVVVQGWSPSTLPRSQSRHRPSWSPVTLLFTQSLSQNWNLEWRRLATTGWHC